MVPAGPSAADASARRDALLERLRPFHRAIEGGDGSDALRPRPLLMGVLNVTPDSFSDGGLATTPEAVREHMRGLVDAGAEVIDVGAESTRPGSLRVDAREQLRRLETVFAVLTRHGLPPVPLTVDTTLAEVAEAALRAGFAGVNDVSAGLDDPRMLQVVQRYGAVYVLMHMRGQPATMQNDPRYGEQGVVAAVGEFLHRRRQAAESAGLSRDQLLADVGIGFGKADSHNLLLLKHLQDIEKTCGLPLLVGTSRKGFLGRLTGRADPRQRGYATAATVAWAAMCGAAVVRVHDVAEMHDVLVVLDAIRQADRLNAP